MTIDEMVKELGFESEKEFNTMVASLNISTPDKYKAFRIWKDTDGSKPGLAALIKEKK